LLALAGGAPSSDAAALLTVQGDALVLTGTADADSILRSA